METKSIYPEMCECERLYKDRRDENGKMICFACQCNCSIETLKNLWTVPVPDEINKIFGTKK